MPRVVSQETREKISKSLKGRFLGNTRGFKKGHTLTKGRPAPWARNNPQTFKKGHMPWSKSQKGIHLSPETEFKKGVSASPATQFKKGQKPSPIAIEKNRQRRGSRNNLWKGGITPINQSIRTSSEIKLWKKACLERDNFTCQKTRVSGGYLEVHHINNFADYPELRFAIDNGICLCREAHREFHMRYGKRNNTREQLEEFLKSTHAG